jgi:SAM-dependent methyltransferase
MPCNALEAYERTAPYYDTFTAHHDYELWIGNLLEELRRSGLEGRGLLDLACGTGKSSLPMLARGWRVVGVDLSPAMLARARAKCPRSLRLVQGDMRSLPVLGSFDLVWALDDAVNYLRSTSELRSCLNGFARNLGPGGLCLFDVNTLGVYRGFFAETHRVDADGHRLVWRGQASRQQPAGSETEAWLEVEDAGGHVVERAIHRQRHFETGDVKRALAAAGLECIRILGHGYDAVLEEPLEELRHTKAIVIARRLERR